MSATEFNLSYTGQQINDSVKKIIDGEVCLKSKSVNINIAVNLWTGTTSPFTATLSVIGVTGTSANELLPNLSDVADVAKNQLKALQSANIIGYSQAKDTITLKAYGDKPSMDLPITVIIRSDL